MDKCAAALVYRIDTEDTVCSSESKRKTNQQCTFRVCPASAFALFHRGVC